jgi:DNA-binding PadR family transcriptional regulator
VKAIFSLPRTNLPVDQFGLLLIRPMYGLEIKKEIETSTQGKMKLGASTIYQLLRRLEKRSLVTARYNQLVNQ